MKNLFLQTLRTIVLSSIIQGMLFARTAPEPIFTGQYSGKEFQREVQNSTNSGQIKLPDGSGYVFTYKNGNITYTVDVNQRWEVTNISKSEGLLSNTAAESQTPLTPQESGNLSDEAVAGIALGAAGLGALAGVAGYEIKKRYDTKKAPASAEATADGAAAEEAEKEAQSKAIQESIPEKEQLKLERKTPSNPLEELPEDNENTPRPLTSAAPLPEDPDKTQLRLGGAASALTTTRALTDKPAEERPIAPSRLQQLLAKGKATASRLNHFKAKPAPAYAEALGDRPTSTVARPPATNDANSASSVRPSPSGAFSYRNTALRGTFGTPTSQPAPTQADRPVARAQISQITDVSVNERRRQLRRTQSLPTLRRQPN